MKILPYKKGLNSTGLLKFEGCMILSPTSRPRRGSVVHSWGASDIPEWAGRVKWINHPAATKIVANKANWAQFCQSSNTAQGLDYTFDKQQAEQWAACKGRKVICRTVLNGSNGKGIVVARNPNQVVDAPLYSIYFKKTSEYRIMYSAKLGFVFCWSKRRVEGVDMNRDQLLIRNIDSGYTYQRESLMSVPAEVMAAVIRTAPALQAYGLELLAYDVAYNSDDNMAVLIEANTAPGLGESTAPLTYDVLKELEKLA